MNLPGSRPLIAGLFLFALSAGLVSADDVLVNGQRPLTQPMVNDVSDFFEWLLEAPMTGIQRQQMQQSLVDSWNRGDEADIETTRDVLKLRADLAGVSEDERALVRVQLQREVLPPCGSSRTTRWRRCWLASTMRPTPRSPRAPPR